MLRLRLDPHALPEISVAGCATWETIGSLAVLARYRVRGGGRYAQWAHGARQRVAPELVGELWRRVSLTSPPPPGELASPDFTEHFGESGLAPLFEQYWATALEPHWSGMVEALLAETERRRRIMAARGWATMLGSIDARLSWRAPDLVSPHRDEVRYSVHGGSLRLVPMVFGGAWSLFTAIPDRALSYALPGASDLRDAPSRRAVTASAGEDALAVLLGARRAQILRCLGSPSTTTTLSETLGIAPSTASEHLRALLTAGAVRRTRRGNEVFYELDRAGFVLTSEFS